MVVLEGGRFLMSEVTQGYSQGDPNGKSLDIGRICLRSPLFDPWACSARFGVGLVLALPGARLVLAALELTVGCKRVVRDPAIEQFSP